MLVAFSPDSTSYNRQPGYPNWERCPVCAQESTGLKENGGSGEGGSSAESLEDNADALFGFNEFDHNNDGKVGWEEWQAALWGSQLEPLGRGWCMLGSITKMSIAADKMGRQTWDSKITPLREAMGSPHQWWVPFNPI
jgi:hypothetical protein